MRSASVSSDAFDLHAHSIFSDGTFSVEELIAAAREAGLAGIAVTDHDSLVQLERIRTIARAAHYPVLAGTEVSAADPSTKRKVHILAFGLEASDDGSTRLERLLAKTCSARTENTLRQARVILTAMRGGERPAAEAAADPRAALAACGCACVEAVDTGFSLKAVEEAASSSTAVFKQHVMDALTHLPYTDPVYQRVYRSLFKGDGIAAGDIGYPSGVEVVRAIVEAGGVAVLAHPGQMDSWGYVPDLVSAGLSGIEAWHPDHTEADIDHALRLAREHALFVTGGSDFHGHHGAPASLGVCRLDGAYACGRVLELFEREESLR